MTLLSAVILTRNEEEHLPACLASVSWADEVLVLDSFSSDRTVQIARAAGARVEQRQFVNYAAQRNAALKLACGEWVLFVDADERVSEELRPEIRSVVANRKLVLSEVEGSQTAIRKSEIVGYWIPRQNIIFGAWVRHAGWYPDRQLRLLRPARARYDSTRPVHELVLLDGEAGILQGHLLHLNYETPAEFIRKQKQYAHFDAEKLFQEGTRARPHHFVLQPIREFRRRYFSLQGYRDGWRGLLLSVLMSWYMLEVYRQLWQARRSKMKTGR